NLNEKILAVDAAFDFMFCPCLLDTKKKDIEALPDGDIAITLFNGSLRTEENREMAHLMRKKSKILIAFGSCSSAGCVTALGNLSPKGENFKTIYLDSPSVDNPKGIIPTPHTTVPEGVLELPAYLDRVKSLAQEVDVDYFIPGCPPEPHQIWSVIQAVTSGKPLPPKGSVLGGGTSSVCEECSRTRGDKKIKELRRTFDFKPEPDLCLLEQGLICMGIATRNGCGALCPKVNMPCTGCYGPPEGVEDQGAKMIGALGSIVDVEGLKELKEEEINTKVDEWIRSIPDLAGTFYKYTLAESLLNQLKGRKK
ncbi:MAG TPA: NADH:ubiquinone oxidoreductase, partial [Bdellovibrionales bacterium]|nr:NADH:ubiquinone oxidoreductase [Bdellovibrionales bacterium]